MLNLDKQNRLRQRYHQMNPHWRPATEIYAKLVSETLQPDDRVLDLGAGRGGLVEQLKHPLELCIGLDPDLVSLQEHRLANEVPPLARVAANSQHIPFADHQFALILAAWVLEHLAEPEKQWLEIARVLRPGGRCVFITPNKRHPLTSLNRLFGSTRRLQGSLVNLAYGRQEADSFQTYYLANTVVDLQRLVDGSGLQLSHLQTIADPTYLAFNEPLFRLSCWLDNRLPENRRIHLVGIAEK